MLRAEKISVRIGDKVLLHDISLQVEAGKILAIVGPNGAGKSTLLKALSAEVDTAQGEVIMNGRRLKNWNIQELAKCRAILPQQTRLSFPFSVIDVVLMGRSPHNHKYLNDHIGKNDHNYEIVNKALAATDTYPLRERTYTTLSGGEQQRVQLARILAQIWEPVNNAPRYLLLDEPTSSLDLAHQHSTLKIAQQFAREQSVGVFAILHDLNLAAQYADQILMLKQGVVIDIDTPSSVLTAETIESTFGYPVHIACHPENSDCPLVIPRML